MTEQPLQRGQFDPPAWTGVTFGTPTAPLDLQAGSPQRSILGSFLAFLWDEPADIDEQVVAIRPVPPSLKCFGFHALEIRRVGAYTYSRVVVQWELDLLTWATLCIDRPDERYKLARAAFSACPPEVKAIIPLPTLSLFVDQFCAGVWPRWVAAHPQEATPTPISAARSYTSHWASDQQRAEIIALRRQLGVLDSADIPSQLTTERAERMLLHLRQEIETLDQLARRAGRE